MPRVGYIAYIDEAGDDGIKKLRTATEGGASEWMVISALVVHASNDLHVLPWLKDMISRTNSHQIKHLHFHTLDHESKLAICRCLAEKEVYLFSVISYKKTMEGRINKAAERVNINKSSRFYCWMSRLLLEEVTNFIGKRTFIDYNEITKLKVVFSDRGGLVIEQFRNYFSYLQNQSITESLYINEYNLDWSVVDTKEMYCFANKDRAGLQLADTVASSFYCGLEQLSATAPPTSEYAKMLMRRMATDDRRSIHGCGVKFMPRWLSGHLKVTGPAKDLIAYYANK